MAYRRKARTTVTRRRTSSPRRRRSSFGAAFSASKAKASVMTAVNGALGGVAAALLTNVIGKDFLGESNAAYTGLIGAVAGPMLAPGLIKPEIAAGMAGYAGAKVAANLTGVEMLQENYTPSNMYLQGYDTPGLNEGEYTGSNIYASNYTLAGYGVPGL
jgi:hypothetical protein